MGPRILECKTLIRAFVKYSWTVWREKAKEIMPKKSGKPVRLEMINRVAAVIRPKAPFLAWIHSIPDMEMEDFTLDKLRSGEQTIYLLPECFSLDESYTYVDKIYKTIFETELAGWWTDPEDWPKKMTVKMFHEWFDVELHSTVIDTTGDDFLILEY